MQRRWKEEVVYWEGRVGFVFDGGWGVDPPVLYVPSEAEWDESTPPWMAGRRDEIVARLTAYSGHVLEVGPYRGSGIGRCESR